METIYTSIYTWVNKEDVVYLYNGISLNHKNKNEIMPSAATWMGHRNQPLPLNISVLLQDTSWERSFFFFSTSPISWLWGSSRTIHEEKLYRRSKWHSAVLILKPTDLGHFTVLSPIYPVGQISSLTFQQKLFRNSIALDSNLVKELKYALLLLAGKTVAKLYS